MDAKEIARTYFDRIGFGHRNAVIRPDIQANGYDIVDRRLRELIEYANNNGDCIINTGYGYFRPIPQDPVDALYFKQYIAQENARAQKVTNKINSMETVFDNWEKEGSHGVPLHNPRYPSGTE